MRRFSFSLDPALRFRRHVEERAEVDLAAKQRAVVQEKDRLEELQRELQSYDRERESLQQDQLDLGALIDAERFRAVLFNALQVQEERVEAAGAAATACLATLRQCRLEREALERLRERRLAEYREQELRAEQQLLDEAAVLRWREGGRDEVMR
jgi:flagellar FliJ protein